MTAETSKDTRIHYLYRITNKQNGKIYIGQTVQPDKRWSQHRNDAAKPTMVIHHAIKKYGADNFEFEVIAGCKTWEDTNDVETLLVSQYGSLVPNGYNIAPGGMNAPKTEEWKRKVSQALMGHEVSQETRDKVSKGNTGKVRSEEFKQGVSAFHTGKFVSEETRQLLSEINTGKKASEETKLKIGAANKGRKLSEEARRRIGDAIRGTSTVHKGRTWKVIGGKRVWVDK